MWPVSFSNWLSLTWQRLLVLRHRSSAGPQRPASGDRKIIGQYGIDVSKWARTRRKKAGHARVQYLRYGRFLVILATHGEHPFFTREGNQVRDIRRYPIHFMGYAIGEVDVAGFGQPGAEFLVGRRRLAATCGLKRTDPIQSAFRAGFMNSSLKMQGSRRFITRF